jgi:hypothetical protein
MGNWKFNPFTGRLDIVGTGGGGSQTPWTSDIDAAGFNLLSSGDFKLKTNAATTNKYFKFTTSGIEFISTDPFNYFDIVAPDGLRLFGNSVSYWQAYGHLTNNDYLNISLTDNLAMIDAQNQIGTCNLQITASGGNISFDNENLTTTGTIGAGAITGTSLTAPMLQNTQDAANYTLVATDAEQVVFHSASDPVQRTYTIPSNTSVPYPIGTALTFICQHGAGNMAIILASDTIRLAGTGATGSRLLAADGIAVAIKIAATQWIISGTNLT